MSAPSFAPAGTKPAAPMRPVTLEPPAPGDVPLPPVAPPESPPQYESSPTTMMDGGALRDHAHRIDRRDFEGRASVITQVAVFRFLATVDTVVHDLRELQESRELRPPFF